MVAGTMFNKLRRAAAGVRLGISMGIRPPDVPQEARGGGPWFTASQAARYVGVCAETMRRWDNRGWVRAYRLPSGHRRFSQRDLDAAVRDMGE